MSLPRIAVVGSCVSRDVFNTRFTPEYKTQVEVVDTLYQSSLPSLVRELDIESELPDDVRPNFESVMKKELLGKKLARLAGLQPDILLIDFFADVHFGVTNVAGQQLTRNHMAFMTLESADNFYNDQGATPPERMRFTKDDDGKMYRKAAKACIEIFGNILKESTPDTTIVLNSARFATGYRTEGGELTRFDNSERLLEKNENWAELDKLFMGVTGCEQITHQQENLLGSTDHPWGLHPVHYAQNYYTSLWEKLIDIVAGAGKA